MPLLPIGHKLPIGTEEAMETARIMREGRWPGTLNVLRLIGDPTGAVGMAMPMAIGQVSPVLEKSVQRATEEAPRLMGAARKAPSVLDLLAAKIQGVTGRYFAPGKITPAKAFIRPTGLLERGARAGRSVEHETAHFILDELPELQRRLTSVMGRSLSPHEYRTMGRFARSAGFEPSARNLAQEFFAYSAAGDPRIATLLKEEPRLRAFSDLIRQAATRR